MPNFASLENFLNKYFPGEIDEGRLKQFRLAFEAYPEWNEKINVISRKDIENLAERHFLHSLSIAKVIRFKPGTKVLDVGTGGGFPGIALAIFFPEAEFHLVDSRAKKIRVVQEIVQTAGLENVQYSAQRVEEMTGQFDFVVSRAVASMDKFIPWVRKRIHCRSKHELKNGILYLRGGEPEEGATPISDFFEEPFFREKFVLYKTFC